MTSNTAVTCQGTGAPESRGDSAVWRLTMFLDLCPHQVKLKKVGS
jgi:hypothetical protein